MKKFLKKIIDLFTSPKVRVNVTMTVNERKIDPNSKEGRRIVKEMNRISNSMDSIFNHTEL